MECACLVDAARKKEGKRGKDLDYTVVPTEECPADFLAEINKKNINPFQMTYEDGEYCYLAVGYGEQETNGFSVRVLVSMKKGDGVVFETNLLGPEKGQEVSQKKEYAVSCRKNEKIWRKKLNFGHNFSN